MSKWPNHFAEKKTRALAAATDDTCEASHSVKYYVTALKRSDTSVNMIILVRLTSPLEFGRGDSIFSEFFHNGICAPATILIGLQSGSHASMRSHTGQFRLSGLIDRVLLN